MNLYEQGHAMLSGGEGITGVPVVPPNGSTPSRSRPLAPLVLGLTVLGAAIAAPLYVGAKKGFAWGAVTGVATSPVILGAIYGGMFAGAIGVPIGAIVPFEFAYDWITKPSLKSLLTLRAGDVIEADLTYQANKEHPEINKPGQVLRVVEVQRDEKLGTLIFRARHEATGIVFPVGVNSVTKILSKNEKSLKETT
jgi:hypothetical protein